jgi:hypothetical protein
MARSSIRALMIAVLFSAVIVAVLRDTTDLLFGSILFGVLAASGIIGMSALNLRRKERHRSVGDALVRGTMSESGTGDLLTRLSTRARVRRYRVIGESVTTVYGTRGAERCMRWAAATRVGRASLR